MIRWLGIISVAPGLLLVHLTPDRLEAAYTVLAIAIFYNGAVQYLIPRRPSWFINGYATAVGDALLNIGLVQAGGGFASPFYYILFTVTISAAMRYGYGPALAMAVCFISLDVGEHLSNVSELDGAVLFRSGFLAITALLAGYLREQAHLAEVALQDRLDQATLLNQSTAILGTSLEANVALHAVADAACRLFGGDCAVLQPGAPGVGADPAPVVVHHMREHCSVPHDELLRLTQRHAAQVTALPIDRRQVLLGSGHGVFLMALRSPVDANQSSTLGVALSMETTRSALAPDVLDSFRERCVLAVENATLYGTRKHLYEEVRRQAETLRDNEAQLRAVLSNVAEGILTTDELGSISSLNRAAEEVFGYSEPELLGQPFSRLLSGPTSSAVSSALSILQGWAAHVPTTVPREAVGQRRNGSTFPMEVAVSEMFVGERGQFIVCVRDITERKRAEAALEHQALHDLLTSLPNRMLLHDRLHQALLDNRHDSTPGWGRVRRGDAGHRPAQRDSSRRADSGGAGAPLRGGRTYLQDWREYRNCAQPAARHGGGSPPAARGCGNVPG